MAILLQKFTVLDRIHWNHKKTVKIMVFNDHVILLLIW